MGKTIGVVSLKGGVGKTSSVVALGSAIASFGKRVLLIDGNFSAPNLGLHLNVFESKKTLHDVLENKANLNEVIHTFDDFDFIPASIFSKSKINPLKLRDKIKTIKKNYDLILIDSSPSLNEETLAVMNASDEIIVVTTPDLPTLGTTLKAVKLAKQKGVKIIGLVLNKVYSKNFELSLKDIEKTVDVPVMAVIPHDVNVLKALSKFKSLVSYKPKSEASQEFKKLAAILIKEKYKPVRLKSFFRWVSPKKQDINRTIFYERVFK